MIWPGSNCKRRLFDELNFEFISSMELFKKSIPNLKAKKCGIYYPSNFSVIF